MDDAKKKATSLHAHIRRRFCGWFAVGYTVDHLPATIMVYYDRRKPFDADEWEGVPVVYRKNAKPTPARSAPPRA